VPPRCSDITCTPWTRSSGAERWEECLAAGPGGALVQLNSGFSRGKPGRSAPHPHTPQTSTLDLHCLSGAHSGKDHRPVQMSGPCAEYPCSRHDRSRPTLTVAGCAGTDLQLCAQCGHRTRSGSPPFGASRNTTLFSNPTRTTSVRPGSRADETPPRSICPHLPSSASAARDSYLVKPTRATTRNRWS